MSNPLIFLLIVVVIDLVLKTRKDKKKREEARRSIEQQTKSNAYQSSKKSSSNKSIRELREMLDKELAMGETAKTQEKPELNKNIETVEKRQTREDLIKSQRERVNKHSELEKMKRRKEERKYSRDEYKTPIKQVLVATTHEDKQEFREDILKGIIFSEILGKPKSLKK